jgi:hypothetical protein
MPRFPTDYGKSAAEEDGLTAKWLIYARGLAQKRRVSGSKTPAVKKEEL